MHALTIERLENRLSVLDTSLDDSQVRAGFVDPQGYLNPRGPEPFPEVLSIAYEWINLWVVEIRELVAALLVMAPQQLNGPNAQALRALGYDVGLEEAPNGSGLKVMIQARNYRFVYA